MRIHLDTVDSSIECIFIKSLDFGFGSPVISTGVKLALGWEMCLIGLARISGLDMYTVGLLPQYMDLVIDLYRSECVTILIDDLNV